MRLRLSLPLSPQSSVLSARRSRRGRIYGGVLFYLLGFTILLIFVMRDFVAPVADAQVGADPMQKKHLAAIAWLMLSVLLTYLLLGLILVFRVGRFFFPRATPPRVKTAHIDAWAEAGKRLNVPEEES